MAAVDPVKKLLAQLPVAPKIIECDTARGKQYAFKCQYSNIVSEGRVGIPREFIKPVKDEKKAKNQTLFCGSFRDWNCAAAWLKREFKAERIAQPLYELMMNGVATHGNPTDRKDFCPAPPAEWLEVNALPGSEQSMSIKEWTAKYKGGGQFNGFVETAEKAHEKREEAKREAEQHRQKMALENGGEPVSKNAPKPMIRGGTEYIVGNARNHHKAEVTGGWTACLANSFAANAKHFENPQHPGSYTAEFTLSPIPAADNKSVTYLLRLSNETSKAYVEVHGLQLRGIKRASAMDDTPATPPAKKPLAEPPAPAPKAKGKSKIAPMVVDDDA